MALVNTYTWLAYNDKAIAAIQTGAAGIPLVINGEETQQVGGAPSGQWLSPRIWRAVTIVNNLNVDLNGVSFTIVGTLAGLPQTEVLAGPPMGDIYTETTKLFDSIISVTPNGVAPGVSIGTGQRGQTAWAVYNSFAPNSILGVQVTLLNQAVPEPIKYTFAHTLLDAPQYPPITHADTNSYNAGIVMPNYGAGNAFALVMGAVGGASEGNASGYATFTQPTKFYCIMFEDEVEEGTGVIVNFVQQGLE